MKRTALCAVAAAVAALALCGPGPAEAARSTGKIAYVKKPISVRAIAADGKIDKGNFLLSPDGRTFAFDRFTGTSQLWVMRSDGGGARAVVKRAGAFDGAWAPDGRELAFLIRKGRSGPTDIYKVRLDGSGLKRLTKHGKAGAVHWGRGKLRKGGRQL